MTRTFFFNQIELIVFSDKWPEKARYVFVLMACFFIVVNYPTII